MVNCWSNADVEWSFFVDAVLELKFEKGISFFCGRVFLIYIYKSLLLVRLRAAGGMKYELEHQAYQALESL